jgi:hypothetical protein
MTMSEEQNGKPKHHIYSFAVANHHPKLVQYLNDERAKGRGALSDLIRTALVAYMEQRPPKWFEEWAKMMPQVAQQVEEEIEEDYLGGLFDE